MKDYKRWTQHPITGEWCNATWSTDFFNIQGLGVMFSGGGVYAADDYLWVTSEKDPRTVDVFNDNFGGWLELHGVVFHRTPITVDGINATIDLNALKKAIMEYSATNGTPPLSGKEEE